MRFRSPSVQPAGVDRLRPEVPIVLARSGFKKGLSLEVSGIALSGMVLSDRRCTRVKLVRLILIADLPPFIQSGRGPRLSAL
jgi:hypothetical protein